MVQQPQSPCPQLSRAPVSANRVCSISTTFSYGLTSTTTGRPFNVKLIVRTVTSVVSKRVPVFSAQCAQDSLCGQRELRQTHAHRIIDGIGNCRRHPEGSKLAGSFGAERAVALKSFDDFALHDIRNVMHAGNFIVGKRGIDDLPAVNMHLLE